MLCVFRPKANLFCNQWRTSRVRRDSRVILSNQKSVFSQLVANWFVARQVWFVSGKTHNIAFQLVLKQCCKTSCTFLLPRRFTVALKELYQEDTAFQVNSLFKSLLSAFSHTQTITNKFNALILIIISRWFLQVKHQNLQTLAQLFKVSIHVHPCHPSQQTTEIFSILKYSPK